MTEAQKPDSETLEPCAHCDAKAFSGGDVSTGVLRHFVECAGCGIQTDLYPSEKEAAARWNRRASIPAERGEAVAKAPHNIGEEAAGYRRGRGSVWAAMFDVLRGHHMSNMGCDDDPVHTPYPLVDLMTNAGRPITEGEWEMVVLTDELYSVVDRLRQERDELERYAREATAAITGLTVGGSEYFGKRIGDMYTADLPLCVDHIRSRLTKGAAAMVAKVKAERELLELIAALAEKDCPRPCNGRPDDATVGDCVGWGECGCQTPSVQSAIRAALSKEPK